MLFVLSVFLALGPDTAPLADDTEAFVQAIRAASALARNLTTTACRNGRCLVRAGGVGWQALAWQHRVAHELT